MARKPDVSNALTRALSRRDVLRVGGLLVPSALVAPSIFVNVARAATVAAFDYYIGPSGSDANAGTQASPWAITAINTKRSSYAGKRVGLMDGTYNINSLYTGLNQNGYDPALCVQGGSANSPTVIQAVNLGQAVIDCGLPKEINSTIGQTQESGISMGNVVLDGLKIIRAGVKCVEFGGGGSGQWPGWVVQNCEFTQQDGTAVAGAGGGNFSLIEIANASAPIVRNNYFHGNKGGPTGGAYSGDHFTTTQQWNTRNALYEYNTVLGNGMYGKEGGNFGTTIRYNHIDTTGWSTQIDGLQDFVGRYPGSEGDPGLPMSIHHNVIVSTMNDMRPTLGAGNYYPDRCDIYNNTFIIIGGNSSYGTILAVNTGKLNWYNNIHYAGTGVTEFNAINVDAPGIFDYDCYYSGGNYGYGYQTAAKDGNAHLAVSSLAAWKALLPAGCQAHTLDHQDPNFVRSGSGASFYKLQASSPAKNAGSTNGTSSGSPCEMGAWGNGAPATIGSSLVTGAAPSPIPEAPTLSVS
jgi:hypothetical protein